MSRKMKMLLNLSSLLLGLGAAQTVWADGAVYAMTNALVNNEIKAYYRAGDGSLTLMQTIGTGGGGSGIQLDPTDSLGSQGGLILDREHRYLFAVNTQSRDEDPRDGTDIGDCEEGTISSFRVAHDGGLTLVDNVPSGGLFPASLSVHDNKLFVLNAGGPGLTEACGMGPNITGFKVRPHGQLSPLAHSTRPIDPGTSPGSFLNCDPGGEPFPSDEFRCGLNPPAFPRSPAQIGFTPDGDQLVVTVKGTNSIYVFPVKGGGKVGKPKITQAAGPNQPTYFGFAFDKAGHLIVSEPFGETPTIPAAPKSATSSFRIEKNGRLEAISSSVPSGRGTACWLVLDPSRKRYAYVGNNASSDISTYAIGKDGTLTLLGTYGAPGAPAHLPNDMAVARDGNSDFLYVLNSGNGTVGAFRINAGGSLTSLGAFDGLPVDAGAQGLAAY